VPGGASHGELLQSVTGGADSSIQIAVGTPRTHLSGAALLVNPVPQR